jgi:hypothetical protein
MISITRVFSGDQVADTNLFRRTPQTAVGGQLSFAGEPLGAPAPDFQSLLRQSRF